MGGADEREAAEAEGWCEVFISHEAPATKSVADAVQLGLSVLLLHNLAMDAEREELLCAGVRAAQEERLLTLLRGSNGRAHKSIPGRIRLPVRERLDLPSQHLCDTLLLRSLSLLQTLHGSLMKNLFDGCLNCNTVLANKKLRFADGEPAVNVYTKGGEFKPHEDGQSLTILMPLSHPLSFTGGGTGFWSREDCGEAGTHACIGNVQHSKPTVVLQPPAGTAIIFAGQLTHAGQRVEWGERIVFVSSFSPLSDAEDLSQGTPDQLAPLFFDE